MAEGQYILDTDASNFAIGGVLSQVQDSEERVIAYGSKSLKKPERNYCVTRRELLAIVVFLEKYKHYVGGQKVKVRTDSGSLRWLFNFKNPEGQLARWLEFLSIFDLELEYRPGRRHQNADGLSRRPCKQCGRWGGLLAKEAEERQEAKREAELMLSQKGETMEMGTQTEEPIVVTVEACDVESEQGVPSESDDDDNDDDGTVTGCGEEHDSSPVEIPTLRVQGIPEVSFESLREAQLADGTMAPVLHWKEEGGRPDWQTDR